MSVELDHVIVFVAGPADAAGRFPGCRLDPGRRHLGQGTRNRRVFFDRTFVELLWVDSPSEERATGLGVAARAAPGATCPFGVVLRGRVAEGDLALFVPYEVPGSGGMSLLLLAATLAGPDLPFVAVWDTSDADLSSRWPAARVPPALRVHPSGARGIVAARLRAPAVPDLGGTTVRDVAFEAGEAELALDLDGGPRTWVLRR